MLCDKKDQCFWYFFRVKVFLQPDVATAFIIIITQDEASAANLAGKHESMEEKNICKVAKGQQWLYTQHNNKGVATTPPF